VQIPPVGGPATTTDEQCRVTVCPADADAVAGRGSCGGVWGWSLSLVVVVVASGSGSAYLQYRVESAVRGRMESRRQKQLLLHPVATAVAAP
jgi:hypothetical protein